jgi:proline dehydrogenase
LAASLDHLGEAVRDEAIAWQALGTYHDALKAIDARGLDCSVSVKLTQLGLGIDRSLCRSLVAEIAAAAGDVGTHVTVDMEGSALTQATVDLVADLRADGHDNVGCAVQSYLHRTSDDIRRLTATGASLRLCKGAYDEPEDIAYQDRGGISAAYLRDAELLLRSGTFPRFATHDHRLVHHVRTLARRLEIPDDAYEFQQLHGVREPLQKLLVERGHRVRIYVPFGTHWYPYFVRRLAERPANLVFFLRALVGGRADVTEATA